MPPRISARSLRRGRERLGGEEGVCVFIILSVINYQSGLSLTWSQHIYHPAIAKYDTFIKKFFLKKSTSTELLFS